MKLRDIVFPDNIYCIVCGSIIDRTRKYSLCDRCIERMHWITGRSCPICGRPLQDTYKGEICYDCLLNDHAFDRAFACCEYGLYERTAVEEFKYNGKAYIGRKLAHAMWDRLEPEQIPFDIIVPVPVHKKRKAERGFNQAEIMGRELGKHAGVPCMSDVIIRTENTLPMKGLTPQERRDNIEKAFSIKKGKEQAISGKRILLVDDIYTTGSTFDMCTAKIKEAGAESVICIAFAIGSNRIYKEN